MLRPMLMLSTDNTSGLGLMEWDPMDMGSPLLAMAAGHMVTIWGRGMQMLVLMLFMEFMEAIVVFMVFLMLVLMAMDPALPITALVLASAIEASKACPTTLARGMPMLMLMLLLMLMLMLMLTMVIMDMVLGLPTTHTVLPAVM